MGMVVTSLSHVNGGKSGVKRAVGTMPWHVCWAGGEPERPPSSVRCIVGRPPSSVRATVEGAPMGWPSLEGKARHIPTPSKRDLGVPMAAPLSGTEVPCSPHSDESPKGDRPSPAGSTELASAEASACVAVATIAPLAPVGRGGRSRLVWRGEPPEKVLDLQVILLSGQASLVMKPLAKC